MTDYCGPAGDGWFTKLLSKLIPDYIGSVYIGDCCKDHDEDNTANGANKAGDEKLKECIRCKLRRAFYTDRAVRWYSNKYYIGVRFGNPFYKSMSEIYSDIKKELKRFKDNY